MIDRLCGDRNKKNRDECVVYVIFVFVHII